MGIMKRNWILVDFNQIVKMSGKNREKSGKRFVVSIQSATFVKNIIPNKNNENHIFHQKIR